MNPADWWKILRERPLLAIILLFVILVFAMFTELGKGAGQWLVEEFRQRFLPPETEMSLAEAEEILNAVSTGSQSLRVVDAVNTLTQLKQPIKGYDLSEAEFSGAHFDGGTLFLNVDLSGAKFWNSSLRDARFLGSNLNNVTFYKADLGGAVFESAAGASPRRTKMSLAMFQCSDVRDVTINDVHSSNLSLERVDADGMEISGGGHENFRFIESSLRGITFDTRIFGDFWFTDTDASGYHLDGLMSSASGDKRRLFDANQLCYNGDNLPRLGRSEMSEYGGWPMDNCFSQPTGTKACK